MNVRELIYTLAGFPANTEVFVQGDDDGFDAVYFVEPKCVIQAKNATYYNGEFEAVDKPDEGGIESVVILGRRRTE